MTETLEKGYKVVYRGGTGEIVEKKSRFIATVCPVESEEEAAAFIAGMKKKYWDARHNCSAFVIGKNQELTRCSDDGEPAQTAGRPILDVLLREGIHNAAVVVTRYFGGVLLGTGGLVRAYQKAAQEGLSASTIIEKRQGIRLRIGMEYTELGKLQYTFAKDMVHVMDTRYGADVQMEILVPAGQRQQMEKKLIELTSGRVRLTWGEETIYAEAEGELILL